MSKPPTPRRGVELSAVLAAPFLLLLISSSAQGHPFHVTIAEVEHNLKAQTLEVALKVNAIDLEAVLSKRAKSKIDLEESPNADELIAVYLGEVFQIETAAKTPIKLKWVGKEVEIKTAWLYFEFPVPNGIEGLKISNRIFFEHEPEQINTVNLKQNKNLASLRFTRQAPWADLTFAKPPPPPSER